MSTTCYNIQIPDFLLQRLHGSLGSKETLGYKNAQIVSVGEPQGKKRVARNRPKWKDIKIDFKEIEWEIYKT